VFHSYQSLPTGAGLWRLIGEMGLPLPPVNENQVAPALFGLLADQRWQSGPGDQKKNASEMGVG